MRKKIATRRRQTSRKRADRATTRSTAGPGYDFEDQVAAWLLLKVLSGRPLPEIEGIGQRLQAQTSALGWTIDDLLLTASVAAGDDRRLAISCKSNVQVSASGLPSDFVERTWGLWSASETSPFRRGRDHLLLATRGRHPQFQAAWSDIKREAGNPDSAMALARISATAKHRKIFESLSKPAKRLRIKAPATEALALIQSLDVVPLDFQLSGSEDEKSAIAASRDVLVDGSLPEGRRLWAYLVEAAKISRLSHGTINFSQLRRDLRQKFRLKAHPDYSGSFERLQALTDDYKSRIDSALPSGYIVNRDRASEELKSIITASGACVLYGDSGSGKSALARSALDDEFASNLQIWLGPDQVSAALSEANRAALGLSHPLIDTLDASPRPNNVLVIDAAERIGRDTVCRRRISQ